MSCRAPYRFFLDTGGDPQQVYPIYEDGLEKVVAKADGEQYYRETLEGSLIFVRADYDFIDAADIEDQINFSMEKWDGSQWQSYFSGYFHKTDGEFDLNECREGICTVSSITPRDFYDAILGGMDKEFDLIELAPTKTAVNYFRQPIFQVYALGASVLTCYLGGAYFELPVPSPVSNATILFASHFFGYIGNHAIVFGDDLDPDVSGEYINNVSLDTLATAPTYLRKSDGAYRIEFNTPLNKWQIVEVSTGNPVYTGTSNLQDGAFDNNIFSAQCHVRLKTLFARFVTNQTTVGATPTSDIPDPDIVSNPSGYEKVLAIGLTNVDIPYGTSWQDVTIASAGHSTTPTRYSKFADDAPLYAGKYFTIPSGLGTGAIYPNGESTWDDVSFWFQYDSVLRAFQESGAEQLTLTDGYKLVDALSTVLGQLDASVSHSENSTYSDFLYGASNPIRGTLRYPIITPKSNITVGQYDQPARKGPIKLADILQLLWSAYRCKWHMDTNGNFIIEHISFYENGGTYSGTNVGTDLTTLIDPQTGKSWEFGANKWSYEKEKMPERIEPGWMDRTTREFDGYPIKIRSTFVQKGNTESQRVGRFTSDIDYIQLQPSGIAKEGFAIVDAELVSEAYTVPYVTITLPDSSQFKLQNGYMAFIYLYPNYCRHGLPAPLITLNEENTTALSVTRRKIQEVEYPAFETTDYLALVTTGLGNGKILELREDIEGGFVKVRIAHDTQ